MIKSRLLSEGEGDFGLSAFISNKTQDLRVVSIAVDPVVSKRNFPI